MPRLTAPPGSASVPDTRHRPAPHPHSPAAAASRKHPPRQRVPPPPPWKAASAHKHQPLPGIFQSPYNFPPCGLRRLHSCRRGSAASSGSAHRHHRRRDCCQHKHPQWPTDSLHPDTAYSASCPRDWAHSPSQTSAKGPSLYRPTATNRKGLRHSAPLRWRPDPLRSVQCRQRYALLHP